MVIFYSMQNSNFLIRELKQRKILVCRSAKTSPVEVNVENTHSHKMAHTGKGGGLISPLSEAINQICKKYSSENPSDKKTSHDTFNTFKVTPENKFINSLPV